MKNLYLYLMAMTALMSIIVTVNVLAMSQVKQNEMMERMPDFLSEFNNLLLTDILIYLYPIREIIVTIFNLFIPIMFLSTGAALAWWWFYFPNAKNLDVIEDSPALPVPSTNSSPHHHHDLRPKRQTNFILD